MAISTAFRSVFHASSRTVPLAGVLLPNVRSERTTVMADQAFKVSSASPLRAGRVIQQDTSSDDQRPPCGLSRECEGVSVQTIRLESSTEEICR